MTGKVTLAELESAARAVFGHRFKRVTETVMGRGHGQAVIHLIQCRTIAFDAPSRMAARRLALEALLLMSGEVSP